MDHHRLRDYHRSRPRSTQHASDHQTPHERKRMNKHLITFGCLGLVAIASSLAQAKKTIKIALIAKSSTNPVFLSARTGAEATAKELSAKHGDRKSTRLNSS